MKNERLNLQVKDFIYLNPIKMKEFIDFVSQRVGIEYLDSFVLDKIMRYSSPGEHYFEIVSKKNHRNFILSKLDFEKLFKTPKKYYDAEILYPSNGENFKNFIEQRKTLINLVYNERSHRATLNPLRLQEDDTRYVLTFK